MRSVAPLGFLLLWEFVSRAGLVNRVFLPPFSEIAAEWWNLLFSGQLWEHTSASMFRSFMGFWIAVGLGVPIGLLVGWYRVVDDLLNPLLEIFRNTSPLALLPVFILMLGIGETSKIAIIVYGAFFPILLNTISAVKTVDPLLIKSARSLGFGTMRLFQKVILPYSVPTIFAGFRLAAGFSILLLIAAEFIAARAGLGYLITYSGQNFQVQQMYAAIMTISLIGLLINAGLVRVERSLSKWRPASVPG